MWDVFISHASEDKDDIARPLAEALVNAGLRVWYDEFALKLGDSLSGSIDHGLAGTRYGIVILSPAFFAKEWPRRELDGLNSREISAGKVILPVWHKVGRADVLRFSPILADKLSVSTDKGLTAVVHDILQVLHEEPPALPRSPKTMGSRVGRRTLVLSALFGLTLVTATWLYAQFLAPAYAHARLKAWPLDYSSATFIERARQGDLEAVKLFLAAGIDPNLPAREQEDGTITTALRAAAYKGHTQVMQALIDGHADVNQWSDRGHALLSAAGGGQLQAVKLLLDNGAEAYAIDRALYYAAVGGNADVMRALLEQGAKLDPEAGISALRGAAYEGHTAVLAALLDRGVDVNGRDSSDGFSALTTAVRDDRIEAAALLLQRGADINAVDKDGMTPLMWVTTHEQTARFLIDKGADINAKDKQGMSVLAQAVSQIPYGAEPIVDLLLERGAVPNSADNTGETPLMVGLRSSQSVELLGKLLEKGAEVNVKDKQGYTPLMVALKSPDFETTERRIEPLLDIVRALLKRGARVGDKADDGETALSLAKQLPMPVPERDRVLKLLLAAGKV